MGEEKGKGQEMRIKRGPERLRDIYNQYWDVCFTTFLDSTCESKLLIPPISLGSLRREKEG